MNDNTPKFISVNSDSEVVKIGEHEYVEWNQGSAPVYHKNFQRYCIDEDSDLHETLTTWTPYDLTWGGDEPIELIKQYILSGEGNGFSYYAVVRDSKGHGYPLPLLFEDSAESELGVEEAHRLRQEVLEWAKSV